MLYCLIFGKYRKSEKPKTSYFLEKHQFFLLFSVSARMSMKKKIKEEESIEIL